MISFLHVLKNEIVISGKFNWNSLSYLLSAPIGLLACYTSIKLGIKLLKNPSNFHRANLKISFFLALVFVLKIPYVVDKPVALLSFVLNFIGWFISFLILLVVYEKHKKLETSKKNHIS